jgi:hypothetical protein
LIGPDIVSKGRPVRERTGVIAASKAVPIGRAAILMAAGSRRFPARSPTAGLMMNRNIYRFICMKRLTVSDWPGRLPPSIETG